VPMTIDAMSGPLVSSDTCSSLVSCPSSLPPSLPLSSPLSGCPPFYGSNSDAIHDMILTEEADFTSKRFSHVSALALDFLQKLLIKDVNRRLTPQEALAHPFIQQVPSSCPLPLTPDPPP
jgi:serine/threonine protein kinase